MKPVFLYASVAMCVSACGGSSTSFSFEPIEVPTFNASALTPSLPIETRRATTPGIPAYDSSLALLNSGISQLDRVDALGLTIPNEIPRSGSAVFEGTIVLQDESLTQSASVHGGLQMTVDFADAEKVTGRAGNFFDGSSDPVDGTLTLSEVEFSESTSGGGFVGTLNGRLTNVGGSGLNGTYDYDLTYASTYYGADVEGILALAGGTATQLSDQSVHDITGGSTMERQ